MALDQEVKIILKTLLDDKGFQQLYENSRKTNTAVDDMKKAFMGLLPAMSAAAVVAAMKSMSDQALKYADAVDKVSDITGVSAEQASKWVVQAQHVGTSSDTVANGMAILSRNLVQGSDDFERFGVAIRDKATKELLPLDQIIANVRQREKELGEGANSTAMEMALFGKSGKELHDFLSANNTEMAAVTEKAKGLGLILDDLAKDKAEETSRKLNDLQMVGQGLGGALNELVLPVVLDLAQAMLSLATVVITAKNAFGDWLTGFHKMKELSKEELDHLKELVKQYQENESKFSDLQKNNFAELNTTQEKIREEIQKTTGLDMLMVDHRKEIEKTVTNALKEEVDKRKILTAEELKAKKDAAAKQSDDYFTLLDNERKGQEATLAYQKKTDIEKAKSDLTYWTEKVANAKAKGLEYDKEEAKRVEAFKKVNVEKVKNTIKTDKEIAADTKKTAGLMADAFMVGATDTESAWKKLGKDITNTLVTDAFTPMASGLNSMLSGFGDIAKVLVPGIGGVIGSVVGGFLSLLGDHSKSVADYTKEAYKDMVDKTNKKLDDIGRKKTNVNSAVGLVNKISEGVSHTTKDAITGETKTTWGMNATDVFSSGTQAEAILATTGINIVGMTKKEALTALYGASSALPTEYDALTAEKTRLTSALPILANLQYGINHGMPYSETQALNRQLDALGYDTHGTSGLANNEILGFIAAANTRLTELNNEIGAAQLAAATDQINISKELSTLDTADDFISRPGQPLTKISPDDTVVGVKDTSKLSGGIGGGITIQMTNSFSGINWTNEGQKDAIARDLASRIKAYVDGNKRLPTGELRRF